MGKQAKLKRSRKQGDLPATNTSNSSDTQTSASKRQKISQQKNPEPFQSMKSEGYQLEKLSERCPEVPDSQVEPQL
ncbi:MAG: hypothetical protein ACFBSC_07740 [Microcoleaceae cyanobacterium]